MSDRTPCYSVGYKKPPTEHQFKKGVRQPASAKPQPETFRSLILEMLARRVQVKGKDGAKWVTMREAIVAAQTNRAVTKCDPETLDLLAELSQLLDGNDRQGLVVVKIRPESIEE